MMLPEVGTLFHNRYRLKERLASGGMGAVYAAQDQTRSLEIAIKILHPELTLSLELHRRFRREAAVLQALKHPGIVQVYDIGTDGEGRAFTTMELLRGETLADRLSQGQPIALPELISIMADTCDSLTAAHEHGVIHGDIKPPNIFITDATDDGVPTVKLVDFGLSKIHGLERLTRTGEVIGTPVYMAPELLTGSLEIDHSVDTYAVGVVLYEAIAGVVPFQERNPGKLLYHIVTGNCAPLSEVVPAVPEALAATVAQAMYIKPSGRFPSAAAMAEQLRRCVSS